MGKASRTQGVHYHQLYQLVAIANGGGNLGGMLKGIIFGRIVDSTTETEVEVGRGFGVDLMEATIPLWHELGVAGIKELMEAGSQKLICAKALRRQYSGAGVRHTNALRSVYKAFCKGTHTPSDRICPRLDGE